MSNRLIETRALAPLSAALSRVFKVTEERGGDCECPEALKLRERLFPNGEVCKSLAELRTLAAVFDALDPVK